MPGTLSERFSKLKATGAATAGKTKRGVARTVVQTNARQNKTDARRRGSAASNGSAPSRNGKKGVVSIKKGVSNAKGRKGKGGRGNKKTGEKKGPVSAMDLDKDLDTHWFKGGKGKDPNLLALDNDLDSYLKGKPTEAAPATA